VSKTGRGERLPAQQTSRSGRTSAPQPPRSQPRPALRLPGRRMRTRWVLSMSRMLLHVLRARRHVPAAKLTRREQNMPHVLRAMKSWRKSHALSCGCWPAQVVASAPRRRRRSGPCGELSDLDVCTRSLQSRQTTARQLHRAQGGGAAVHGRTPRPQLEAVEAPSSADRAHRWRASSRLQPRASGIALLIAGVCLAASAR
jgi:hypothetical protein